jgi:hypothetical protein
VLTAWVALHLYFLLSWQDYMLSALCCWHYAVGTMLLADLAMMLQFLQRCSSQGIQTTVTLVVPTTLQLAVNTNSQHTRYSYDVAVCSEYK